MIDSINQISPVPKTTFVPLFYDFCRSLMAHTYHICNLVRCCSIDVYITYHDVLHGFCKPAFFGRMLARSLLSFKRPLLHIDLPLLGKVPHSLGDRLGGVGGSPFGFLLIDRHIRRLVYATKLFVY